MHVYYITVLNSDQIIKLSTNTLIQIWVQIYAFFVFCRISKNIVILYTKASNKIHKVAYFSCHSTILFINIFKKLSAPWLEESYIYPPTTVTHSYNLIIDYERNCMLMGRPDILTISVLYFYPIKAIICQTLPLCYFVISNFFFPVWLQWGKCQVFNSLLIMKN